MEEGLEERKQNPVWRGGKELDQKLIEGEGETQRRKDGRLKSAGWTALSISS